MSAPFREVGACTCVEHQAGQRYREIVAQLNLELLNAKKEIDEARRIIKELAEMVGYWREDDIRTVDSAGTGNPVDRVSPVADEVDG